MTITGLMKELKTIQDQFGDIRCMVSGFDEADYDDIETVKLIIVKQVRANPGHSGIYAKDPQWFSCSSYQFLNLV